MLGFVPIAAAPIAALISAEGVGRVGWRGSGRFSASGSAPVYGAVVFDGRGILSVAGRVIHDGIVHWAGGGSFALGGMLVFDSRIVFRGQGYFLTAPYINRMVDSQVDIQTGLARWDDGLSTVRRPHALTFDYRRAFTLGPVSIGDPNQGILGWAWYVRVEDGVVYYARSNDAYDGWQDEDILFTFTGDPILELDTCFEQNGRIAVVAQRSEEIWLYWYKPSEAAFVFEKVDDGRTPRTVLDNPNDTSIADVHIAYIKDGSGLLTRRQSELYATPHATNHPESSGWFLEEFARNRGNRLAAILSRRTGIRYSLTRIESTLFPFYNNDGFRLYPLVVDGELLVQLKDHTIDPSAFSVGPEVLDSSTLVLVVLSTEPHIDAFEVVPEFQTASALDVVVLVTEHHIDAFELVPVVSTASTLVRVIILDELQDHGMFSVVPQVRTTSTLEVP